VTADPQDHIEVWIIDKEAANNAVSLVVADAAATVKQLRNEGKTVFLHCVHAHTRTPVVAAAYGALITGDRPREVLDRVLALLPEAYPRPSIVAALDSLSCLD